MAILVTLHTIQSIQTHPRGDHIVCRCNGALVAPADATASTADSAWLFAAGGQEQRFNRTLLTGTHGDGCTVTLSTQGEDGQEIALGCVEITIEQNSVGFSECVASTGATLYRGLSGKLHQVELHRGERRYRLRFRIQLITDL